MGHKYRKKCSTGATLKTHARDYAGNGRGSGSRAATMKKKPEQRNLGSPDRGEKRVWAADGLGTFKNSHDHTLGFGTRRKGKVP